MRQSTHKPLSLVDFWWLLNFWHLKSLGQVQMGQEKDGSKEGRKEEEKQGKGWDRSTTKTLPKSITLKN